MLESRDPVEAVIDLVEQLDSLVEKFALVAEETKHDAVRVGALRSQLSAMEQRFTVLHMLGLVPSLDLVRVDVDMRRVTDTAVNVLERHEVGGEVFDDLLEGPRSIGRPRGFLLRHSRNARGRPGGRPRRSERFRIRPSLPPETANDRPRLARTGARLAHARRVLPLAR